jgi:hypothetical protein
LNKAAPISILIFFISQYTFAADYTETQIVLQYLTPALLVIFLVLFIVYWISKKIRIEDTEPYKQLSSRYEDTVKQQNQLQGQNEQLIRENSKMESQLSVNIGRISELERKTTEYETNQQNMKKEVDNKISELENSRKELENERNRIIEDERIKKAEFEENRSRIWAIHEDKAKTMMREICRKSEIALPCFDNTNLPDGFDTKLKPDFMVLLLGQYVIFDPKTSQSQNIQTYIKTQVQQTAKKIKGSVSFKDIYKTVFLVFPSIGLQEINETYFVEQGISFFIISLEAFEPIIRTLRRLEDYELAEKYDPQERENIVNVLALYDLHIRQQNATNILTTIRGLKVMEEKKIMPEDVYNAIESRREKLRTELLTPAEIKKLIDNPELQAREILSLIAPREPDIKKQDLNDAEPFLE